MSVVETILVFVVAPGVVVGVMALLVWGRGEPQAARYRPGRHWPYKPVWYAPHPLAVPEISDDDPHVRRPAVTAGSRAPDLPSTLTRTAAGGARGIW